MASNHFKKPKDFEDAPVLLFKSFSLTTEVLIKAAFFSSCSSLDKEASFKFFNFTNLRYNLFCGDFFGKINNW